MDATELGRLLAGRYRLTAVIGQGGMGVVWRGRDELLGRDVAVKEIIWPPYLTEHEQQVACLRATREAQMAGRLCHRNVIRIYDIVEDAGHPCIVMEFLPYKSLRDLVRDEGPLPPARAALIGLGVLGGLSAAHAEGILHRDVKPANILVGPDGRVVLTDFGIARAADSATLTGDGALLGSPSYIAPERARGGQPGAGVPADLWGLGASLYAAVEGHPPFERNGALATLTAVVADEPDEAPHEGPLEPVIGGLLQKDPRRRLDAAAAERLLRYAAGPTQPARPGAYGPASAAPWPGAPPRPRGSGGLLAALVVLLVAAAAAVGLAFTLTSAPGAQTGVRGHPGTVAPRHPSTAPRHLTASPPVSRYASPPDQRAVPSGGNPDPVASQGPASQGPAPHSAVPHSMASRGAASHSTGPSASPASAASQVPSPTRTPSVSTPAVQPSATGSASASGAAASGTPPVPAGHHGSHHQGPARAHQHQAGGRAASPVAGGPRNRGSR